MPENLDLILGAAQSGAKVLQPMVDAQHAETARQQPLSPYEKYLGMVMSGQMSVNEASVRARHEMGQGGQRGPPPPVPPPPEGFAGGQGAPQQPPNPVGPASAPAFGGGMQVPQQYGYSPGMYQAQSAPPMAPQGQGAPSYSAPQSQSAPAPQMAQPRPAQSVQGPQTRGDMATLQASAPFLRTMGQDTSDDKMLRLLASLSAAKERNDADNNTSVRGQDVRAGTASESLDERKENNKKKIAVAYRAIDASLQRAELIANSAMDRLTTGGGQNLELEALKLEAADLRTQQNNFADVVQSIPNLADNPRAVDYMEKNAKDLSIKANAVLKKMEALSKRGTTGGRATQTSRGPSTRATGSTALPPGSVGRTARSDGPVTARDGTKLVARGGFLYQAE